MCEKTLLRKELASSKLSFQCDFELGKPLVRASCSAGEFVGEDNFYSSSIELPGSFVNKDK